MPATASIAVKKTVSATEFRDQLKDCLNAARDGNVVLVENRRQSDKYVVDREWLDEVMRTQESMLATLEILADHELTERLLKTAATIEGDLRKGRLKTMAEVFGE